MTLQEYLTIYPNPTYDQVDDLHIVFSSDIVPQIESLNSGHLYLMPTRIDDTTYFLTADCLLEIDGIYKDIIPNLPQDQMNMVDPIEWLYYQAIIDAQIIDEYQ
jgi:hypothetical protein